MNSITIKKNRNTSNREWMRKNPTTVKLCRTLNSIKKRCKFWPGYLRRGTKNFLTLDDLKFLWEKDKAYKLRWASIDRINNNGDYNLENCRFIEMKENSAKGYVESTLNGIEMNNVLDQLDKLDMSFKQLHKYTGIAVNNLKAWYRGESRMLKTTHDRLRRKGILN